MPGITVIALLAVNWLSHVRAKSEPFHDFRTPEQLAASRITDTHVKLFERALEGRPFHVHLDNTTVLKDGWTQIRPNFIFHPPAIVRPQPVWKPAPLLPQPVPSPKLTIDPSPPPAVVAPGPADIGPVLFLPPPVQWWEGMRANRHGSSIRRRRGSAIGKVLNPAATVSLKLIDHDELTMGSDEIELMKKLAELQNSNRR